MPPSGGLSPKTNITNAENRSKSGRAVSGPARGDFERSANGLTPLKIISYIRAKSVDRPTASVKTKPQSVNPNQTNQTKMSKTKIAGYSIELSHEDDSTQCWVEKGQYSASLQALVDNGCLESRTGGEHGVNPDTIERILDWATENGW